MNIVTIENERKLREKCIPIMKEKSDYMNNLISSMIELMIKNNGCGIAAPQVGINKRLFVAILDNERIGLFVNPTILEHSDEMEMGTEGCLSVPEKCGDVALDPTAFVTVLPIHEVYTPPHDAAAHTSRAASVEK